MPAASLSTVISEADLVVHARVEGIVTALSKDELQVQTLVTFVPVRVFKDKIKSREAASPRMTAPMVFVEAGGTVHVDGLTITQTSGDAITPPLRLGEDLLVCLSKGEQSEYFVLSYGPYGLLRIEGDTVRPANKLVGKTRPLSSYGLSHVVNEVQRLVAETSKKN